MSSTLSITVERCPVSGTLTLSTRIDGDLVRRRYIGFTRREALVSFRAELS